MSADVAAAVRVRLPNRRPKLGLHLRFRDQHYHLDLGFDPESWAIREVFVAPPSGQTGSDMDHLVADIATIVSVALQHGVPAAALAHSLARLPAPGLDPGVSPAPATILGAIVDAVVEEERSV